MTKIFKCDRCGDTEDESHSLLYKFTEPYSNERDDLKADDLKAIDLCDDCFKIVKKYMDGGFKK